MKKLMGSALLLASVYVSAGENYFQDEWDAKGLLALEGAVGTAQAKQTEPNPSGGYHVIDNKYQAAFAGGLKLGGESRLYRIYLSGRYHMVNDYDGVVTLGGELQYLIRAGEHFNIFLGVNGGQLVAQTTKDTTEYTFRSAYAGGDLGVNIDISDNFGLELGARGMKTLADSNEVGAISFLVEGYASLVFKFTGDY